MKLNVRKLIEAGITIDYETDGFNVITGIYFLPNGEPNSVINEQINKLLAKFEFNDTERDLVYSDISDALTRGVVISALRS